jgi:hypothetical protein
MHDLAFEHAASPLQVCHPFQGFEQLALEKDDWSSGASFGRSLVASR